MFIFTYLIPMYRYILIRSQSNQLIKCKCVSQYYIIIIKIIELDCKTIIL